MITTCKQWQLAILSLTESFTWSMDCRTAADLVIQSVSHEMLKKMGRPGYEAKASFLLYGMAIHVLFKLMGGKYACAHELYARPHALLLTYLCVPVLFIRELVSCCVAGNVFITISHSRQKSWHIMIMGHPPAYYSMEVPDEKLTFNKINSGLKLVS